MATSAYASTPETTNANRTCRVLLGPCSDQLRDVLRHYVPKVNFPYVIRHYRPKLPRLTPPQRDLILPRIGHYSGDYSDMDISLLYLLLRNICNIPPHINGWGKSPDVTDTSLAASIERLREARNKVGHSSSTSLSNTDFTDICSYIKDAVKSMDAFLNNGNKYEKEMDFLITETMDPEQEEFYREQLRKDVEEETRTKETVTRLQESVNDQQGDIQNLQTDHQELHRQLTYQQWGIHDVRYQQQELHRQLTDQQRDIHDVRYQQQELHRQLTDQQGIQQTQVIPDDINRLKERLVEINDLEIPLTPLQEDSDKLPIEQLFASVIIKEDSKETRKGKKSAQFGKEQERKEVKTPEDMLTKNGKPVRRVYMLGDAAHGKTTYCTWLLEKWYNAQKPGMSSRPLNEWENALSQFDFVFHLTFRHVDPSRANVIDMICQDILGEDTVLQTAAKHVLSSDNYRCLIIMDGLDEWKPEQSTIDQLKYKGMPNIDNMSNCVIFTTMRPWMFAAVAGLVRDEDRVIEIQGLDDKGIEDVIKKVLVHYYEMKPDSDEYMAKYNEIISKLKNKTLKSFIHIPLLAVVCIQIWFMGKQVGNSLTSFYSVMVDMLIERAKANIKIKTLEDKKITYNLPEILIENENITNHISILLKLGKVAYEGLLSNKENLEFQKRKLEKELGREELQFALDIGLISQTEASSITTKNVNVHFFHKSVQEFLAVMFIATQKKVSDNFCTRLCNVKVIMELSNVIMFICGMCPSLGSVISQRVVSVTDGDGGICTYRKSPWGGNHTVEQLYKLQVSWYREFQYVQTDSPVTDSPVTFHVSDVYLDNYRNTETVRVTRELLSDHRVDIRSLLLYGVPTDGERGITATELDTFLSNTDKARSVVTLYIDGRGRYVHTLCIPSLKTLYLDEVTKHDRHSVFRPVIKDMDRLQRLELGDRGLELSPLLTHLHVIKQTDMSLNDRGLGLTPLMKHLHVIKLTDLSLGDRGPGLTPHMTDLQRIVLVRVRMTQSGWGRLIHFVMDIHHHIVVTLHETDIDSDSRSTLHSCPHISVTCDLVNGNASEDLTHDGMYGVRYLTFSRIWPLTQETQ